MPKISFSTALRAAALGLTAAVFAVATPAQAQKTVFYVAKTGLDANSGLSPAQAKLTIQSAVTATTAAGSIIYVAPSATAYVANVALSKSNIHLIGNRTGQPATNWTPSPGSEAILQASGANAAVTASTTGTTNILIDGFHIIGNGGASSINIAQNAAVSSVTVSNNYIAAGPNNIGSTNGIHLGMVDDCRLLYNVIVNGRNPITGGAGVTTAVKTDDRLASGVLVRGNKITMPTAPGSFNLVAGWTTYTLFLENELVDAHPAAGAFSTVEGFAGQHEGGRFIRNRIINLYNSSLGLSPGILLYQNTASTSGVINSVYEENTISNVGIPVRAGDNQALKNNKVRYNILKEPSTSSTTAIVNDPLVVGGGFLEARNNWFFGGAPDSSVPSTLTSAPYINFSPYVGQPAVDGNDGTTLSASVLSTLTAGNGVLNAAVDVTATTSSNDIAILVLDTESTSVSKPGVGFRDGLRVEGSYRFVTSLKSGQYVAQIRIPYSEVELASIGALESGIHVRKYDHVTKTWILAVAENIGGTASWKGDATPTSNLGDYGFDSAGNYAWANINNAGEFTVGDGISVVPVSLSHVSVE